MKKGLALILAFALLISATGVVIANTPDGSAGNPYIITTSAEFDAMSASNYYKMGNDISLGDESTTTSYVPGTFKAASLDGDGHTITLYINGDGAAALFTDVATAGADGNVINYEIKNLTVDGYITYTSTGNVAGFFVATTKDFINLTMTNCVNKADITTSTGARTGGMIGYSQKAAKIEFINCKNYGTIINSGSNGNGDVGGFVGRTDISIDITGSANYGRVESSPNRHVGGMIGLVNSAASNVQIESSGNYGTVYSTGTGNSGGFIGTMASSSTADISKSFNMGDITKTSATGTAGGIVGSGGLLVKTVIDCFNTGSVSGGAKAAAIAVNLALAANGGLLKNCYNLVPTLDIYNFTSASNIPTFENNYNIKSSDTNATTLSEEAFEDSSSFANWDFATIWTIDGSLGYPFPQLRSIPVAMPEGGDTTNFGGGKGTIISPYIIANATHFKNIANNLGKIYMLFPEAGDTIDLSDCGYVPFNFTGTLKGNNKTIKVNITNNTEGTGLFPAISGAVSITDLTIDGTVSGADRTGAIFGQGGQAPYAITSVRIENCVNKATVMGGQQVGGIGGRLYGSMTASLKNLKNEGDIIGSSNAIGGIFGITPSNSTLINMENTGAVSTTNYYAGGIIGQSYSVNIQNSSNKGTVTAQDSSGGIIGYNSAVASISNTYNLGRIAVTKTSSDVSFGGFVGDFQATGTRTVTTTNCYNAGNTINNGVFIPIGPNEGADTHKVDASTSTYYLKVGNETVSGVSETASQPKTLEELKANYQSLLGVAYEMDQNVDFAYPRLVGEDSITVMDTSVFYSPATEEEFLDEQLGENVTAHHGIAFGTKIESVGNYEQDGFGILLSDTDIADGEFTLDDLENLDIKILEGIENANSDGDFGIRFYGVGIEPAATYYVRTYGIYSNDSETVIIYGEKKVVTINTSDPALSV